MTDDESSGVGRGADRAPIPELYGDRPLLWAIDRELRQYLEDFRDRFEREWYGEDLPDQG